MKWSVSESVLVSPNAALSAGLDLVSTKLLLSSWHVQAFSPRHCSSLPQTCSCEPSSLLLLVQHLPDESLSPCFSLFAPPSNHIDPCYPGQYQAWQDADICENGQVIGSEFPDGREDSHCCVEKIVDASFWVDEQVNKDGMDKRGNVLGWSSTGGEQKKWKGDLRGVSQGWMSTRVQGNQSE